MEQGRDSTATRAGWQLQEDAMRQLRDHLCWWIEAHRRILEHHVKCKFAPVPLKKWALEELAKMEARLA
jgi:hypothetical protein